MISTATEFVKSKQITSISMEIPWGTHNIPVNEKKTDNTIRIKRQQFKKYTPKTELKNMKPFPKIKNIFC